MKKVIVTEKKPIKLWVDDIEEGALQQVKNMANLPFVFKHIAIMPDCHQGYGMPIGGVLAASGVIIPNAVGVDIGCGMCAVKTNKTDISSKSLTNIVKAIKEVVPVGFKHQDEKQSATLMPEVIGKATIITKEYESALSQIGTLGGGNHFIEIQKGSDGFIWIMIHSGSRNIGLKVASYYNKVAVEINKKWFSSVPKEFELAFLPIGTEEARDYIKEMQFCVEFAFANRKLMMENIKWCVAEELNNIEFGDIINIAHNYAAMENHFGNNVMVHRKGATSAKVGQIGIIPGSQGTKSYIVEGLGNKESFMSCSHGAGRKMGRKVAQKELDLEIELKKMKGIVHNIKTCSDLDEAPGAYKDIDVVMDNQTDLVKTLIELIPIAVIKG